MNSIFKHQLIMFIIMVIIGMAFNAMNVLAYRLDDLYVSLTLFYGGLLMASNMMWGMEIVHYLDHGHLNYYVFSIGILLSVVISLYLLRKQFLVDDEQWLKRMISHHSTAITTSENIYKKTQNKEIKKLSKSIIDTQEKEIQLMKSLL
jgi:hypothetical protein